jgi:hypothetical protein
MKLKEAPKVIYLMFLGASSSFNYLGRIPCIALVVDVRGFRYSSCHHACGQIQGMWAALDFDFELGQHQRRGDRSLVRVVLL